MRHASPVFAKNIGNDGIAQYQHAFEFRQLNRCAIENIRIDGYAPDALGADPWPIAFTMERVFSCKVSGLFLNGYAGSEMRNYGALISNAENTSFSDIHVDNVFWGIEFETAVDCTLNGFTINGEFKTSGLSAGAGLQIFSAGVFQNNGDNVAFDIRANAPSKQLAIANGSIIGCMDGALICCPNVHMSNVIANGDAGYGFHAREIQTNGGWFPGQPRQRVENVCLDNCQARFNGHDGFLIEAGTQLLVNGGIYCDNGWDASLGATFRAGIAMIEDASGGGIERVSAANIFCGDTQSFTKTKGASFKPGSTVSSRFVLSLIDPDQIAIGQFVKLVNATGSGDVTARIVALNLDEATVQCSGSTIFADAGNLTSLTGALTSTGNAVTGSGTLFTSEIKGAAWIKVSGNYYHVQRVNSNTSMVIFPAPTVDFAGASAQILAIDVQGIPSQQYGVVTDANVNGPLTLSNINADGAVIGQASIANAGILDIFGASSIMAAAGIYARGGRYAFGSTDLLQAQVHIAKPFADDNLLALSGQAGGVASFGQFGGSQFWQTSNVAVEVGTATAHAAAIRTNGVKRLTAGINGGIEIGAPVADPGAGNLTAHGFVGTSVPVTKTGTSSTIGATDSSIIFNPSGTHNTTLPSPGAGNSGRWLYLKTIAAQAVNSASANVVSLAGGAAGVGILAATAGKWALLQSDGSNWNIIAAN